MVLVAVGAALVAVDLGDHMVDVKIRGSTVDVPIWMRGSYDPCWTLDM